MKQTTVLLLCVFVLSSWANMALLREIEVAVSLDNDLYAAKFEFLTGEAYLSEVEINHWVNDEPTQGYFIPLALAPVASHTQFIIELPKLSLTPGEEYQFHLYFEPSGTEWVEKLGYAVFLEVGEETQREYPTTPYYSTVVGDAIVDGGTLIVDCREFFAIREGTETLRVFNLNLAVAVLPAESGFEELVKTHYGDGITHNDGYFIDLPAVEPIR